MGTTLEALWRDLTFAARALHRRPGFTGVAVLTLAVGIGANAAIFSVVHGVLLEPLPYRAADRIGVLWHEFGNGAQKLPALHPLDLYDYRDRSDLFEEFTLASGREWILGGADDPELVDVGMVEAGFFDFFGAAPVLGRTFTAEEDAPGAARVVVLSHRVWERRFGADPSVVGRSIDLAGTRMQVVGVLPAWFRLELPAEAFLLRDAEVWVPARVDRARLPPRNFTGYTAFGRLRSGVDFAAAQEELDALERQLREEHPVHASSKLEVRVEPLLDDVVKGAEDTLLLLLGAVGLLLLVACANVANLVVARGHARAGELSVRAALGAGRAGLVRLVLAESFLLAGAGGLLGVLLAVVSVELLPSLGAAGVPRVDGLSVDGPVLAFALGMSALGALLFGLLPGLRASRQDPGSALAAAGRDGSAQGGARFRSGLVVGEIALSLVLLVGAGLIVRSFAALGSVDPGYATEGALTFRVNLPVDAFPGPEEQRVFFDRLSEDLTGLAGVEAVAAVDQLPLTGSGALQPYAWNDETAAEWESVTADQRFATPGFFEAMGATLHAGRGFTREDVVAGDRIVVDRRLAEQAFPGESAVGRRLQIAPNDTPEEFRYARIVGVVEHLRLHDLARPHLTQIYFPFGGRARFSMVVRASGDPAALAPVVREQMARLAPGAPVEELRPLSALVRESLAPVRLALTLMTAFGVVALLLAAVGVYGVLSHAVGRRTREIGVRMALGQTPSEVRRLVVVQGMRLAVVALVPGLGLAVVLSRTASGLLYGIEPLDPVTYAATSGVLVLAALLASWLPARRATRVDPAAALKQ